VNPSLSEHEAGHPPIKPRRPVSRLLLVYSFATKQLMTSSLVTESEIFTLPAQGSANGLQSSHILTADV
jgi:hypothetical protein